jgi:hypothetical protein
MRKKRNGAVQNEFDIVEIVNEIGEEVEQVLESRNEKKYFEEVMLLYSLIENLLRWLIFVKALWEMEGEKHIEEEWSKLQSFYSGLNFYTALNIGLSLRVIDFNLYKRIDKMRKERNDLAHQLWIYEHRRDPLELRKTLEALTRMAKRLSKTVEQLANEIGVEEIYKLRLS